MSELYILQLDTAQLETKLFDCAAEVGELYTKAQELSAQVKQSQSQVAQNESIARAEQEALRANKMGVMTAGDAKAREAQFGAYWLEQLNVDVRYHQDYLELRQAEGELLNAQTELKSAELEFTALRAVADLRVARLNALINLGQPNNNVVIPPEYMIEKDIRGEGGSERE